MKARPTTDFAREALFNLLQNQVDIDEIDVLDLFAGSGLITLEFVSRGASSVTAVDIAGAHCKFIAKTAEQLGEDCVDVQKSDVRQFVNRISRSFDVVFADPPYQLDWIEELPNLVLSNGLVTKNGLLIVEHSKETDFSDQGGFLDTRSYGKVNFSFFKP